MTDNGSPLWHLALTEIANQMNAQLHTSLKTTPFEVVFRQKKPINWLTAQERREAKGVETEDGEVITEESLSKELEEEMDEEVIAGFREISEFLNIRVPAPGSTTTAKKATPRPAKQPKQPVSPPKELPATPRAARVVPLPAASAISKPQPPKKSFTPPPPPPPIRARARALVLAEQDEPEMVTIESKPFATSLALAKQYPPGRTIAQAQLAPAGLKFHNHMIPSVHVLLFFDSIVDTEVSVPVPGGQLDYVDPDCEAFNISGLPKGQVFHWPKLLVSYDLPPDFQADLQASIQGSDVEISDSSEEDSVIKKARANNNQARQKMVDRYTKNHVIEEFAMGDIVALKLPRGTRTSTDMKRVFGRVLSMPYEHKYEIQTEWGVVERLFPVKELMRVVKTVADQIEVHGPKTKLSLKKVAEHASSAERVIISCKCKGQCATKRCRCFKEGKRCSVHCHDSAEHDCGFLASLALRTELAIKDNPSKKRGTKRQRANTAGKAVEK
jgi:hypothetical protein